MESHDVLRNGALFKREPVASVDAPNFFKPIPKSFALQFTHNSPKWERLDVGKIVCPQNLHVGPVILPFLPESVSGTGLFQLCF